MPESKPARIFVSYASERAELAADVAAALAVEGHDVFFDRTSLPPGDAYGDHIREEIARSDVFVILITAEILKESSYVLTELKLAKQALSQRTIRILPVVIMPVDYRKVDPWLKRLTALYPEGDTAAEVAAHVVGLLDRTRPHGAAALRPDVAARQLDAFQVLWSTTGLLPKWGREGSLTYANLAGLSRKLRAWYFTQAGGLFFSRDSYSRYAELQNALESLAPDDPAAEVTADDYESIRRLCSALRHQLASDLGTRQ